MHTQVGQHFGENAAVCIVIVHDKNRQFVQSRVLTTLGTGRAFSGKSKFGCEVKYAALPCFAFHPHSSTHQLDDLAGNGQAQARTSESPGGRSVGLCEGLKNQLMLFGRNSYSCVRYAKMEMHGVAG